MLKRNPQLILGVAETKTREDDGLQFHADGRGFLSLSLIYRLPFPFSSSILLQRPRHPHFWNLPMGEKENNEEEASPLIHHDNKPETPSILLPEVPPALKSPPLPESAIVNGYAWTADGLPLAQGSVLGEPIGRTQWNSSICACLGRNDEYCSSDLEVCKSIFHLSAFGFGKVFENRALCGLGCPFVCALMPYELSYDFIFLLNSWPSYNPTLKRMKLIKQKNNCV